MTTGARSPRSRGLPLLLVGSVLAVLSTCIVPSVVAVITFQIANADVELRPGAPFGAAANMVMTAVSCTFMSAFVVMLTAWLTLRGRDKDARALQIVGLVVTALLAVMGAVVGVLVLDIMLNS